MASAAQIEAFAWWLSQDMQGRSAVCIAEKMGCSMSTAEKWLGSFKRQLASVMQREVGSKLKEYVEEYQQVQKTATESALVLANLYQTRVNELSLAASLGDSPDPDELGKLASGLKTVYSLAESASGADVAKRRASQKPVSGGKGDGSMALPDLGAFFLAESVEVETLGDVLSSEGNGSINESGNESGSASAEMPEK